MARQFEEIRNDIRALEARVLALHARLSVTLDVRPLEGIAANLGSFAEMLPVYGSFVGLMEKAYPAELEGGDLRSVGKQ